MGKTYAYNSIIIGFLLGLLVWAKSQKIALGILVFVAVSVVGFIIIRFIEKAIGKGVNAAADAASKAYEKHRQQKKEEENK
ncbi:MAG: hypothetical protein K6F68_04585 [Clostridiales bacterium]|nr:hypothetical protein [Clostridiales bacterium]